MEYIRNAYRNVLCKANLNPKTILLSLNLLARLLELKDIDMGDETNIWAAAYIASHKPNNFKYSKDVDSFCSENNLEKNKLEKYLQNYIDELNLIVFPDNCNNLFYIDREDVLFHIIRSASRYALNEAVLKQVLGLANLKIEELADELTEYFTEKVKVLPSDFSKSCAILIKTFFKEATG